MTGQLLASTDSCLLSCHELCLFGWQPTHDDETICPDNLQFEASSSRGIDTVLPSDLLNSDYVPDVSFSPSDGNSSQMTEYDAYLEREESLEEFQPKFTDLDNRRLSREGGTALTPFSSESPRRLYRSPPDHMTDIGVFDMGDTEDISFYGSSITDHTDSGCNVSTPSTPYSQVSPVFTSPELQHSEHYSPAMLTEEANLNGYDYAVTGCRWPTNPSDSQEMKQSFIWELEHEAGGHSWSEIAEYFDTSLFRDASPDALTLCDLKDQLFERSPAVKDGDIICDTPESVDSEPDSVMSTTELRQLPMLAWSEPRDPEMFRPSSLTRDTEGDIELIDLTTDDEKLFPERSDSEARLLMWSASKTKRLVVIDLTQDDDEILESS